MDTRQDATTAIISPEHIITDSGAQIKRRIIYADSG
nr:MAG TPA: hypothetical protein [Caudoviricetes sp.]